MKRNLTFVGMKKMSNCRDSKIDMKIRMIIYKYFGPIVVIHREMSVGRRKGYPFVKVPKHFGNGWPYIHSCRTAYIF